VLEEVSALCDNVVIIDQGRVAAQGSPAELCRQTGCVSLEDTFVKLTALEEPAIC
jgi:sodium transport system ATP-binding protein